MSISNDDAVLATLLLPLVQRELDWPGRGVFLQARLGAPLLQAGLGGLACQQSFKPDADALQEAGLELIEPELPQRYPIVMVLPPRQRDAARAALARAVALTEPHGRILASAANASGARSHEADLARLVGPLTSLSKHKCRVFWSAALQHVDAELLAQWCTLDAPRSIADGRFLSRPGLFAWDRIDAGSALLAQHFPATLRGRAADLGAGFGYLTAELLARCPNIHEVDLFEAELRALELARRNLVAVAPPIRLGFHWHDVARGLPQRYDVIVSNPPFHVGAPSRLALGSNFIRAAARALHPGGCLWLVANRHLAYESVLLAEFARVRTVVQAQGFKIIEAIKSGERGRLRA
jgi:16S rRNA (guanine1207-N2)-methyltransferase